VTAEPSAAPFSLRSHLRDLQTALDEAAAAHWDHRKEHGCREGSGCAEGRELAAVVERAQTQLGLTRFVNEE
jgi:hypothetical protein